MASIRNVKQFDAVNAQGCCFGSVETSEDEAGHFHARWLWLGDGRMLRAPGNSDPKTALSGKSDAITEEAALDGIAQVIKEKTGVDCRLIPSK